MELDLSGGIASTFNSSRGVIGLPFTYLSNYGSTAHSIYNTIGRAGNTFANMSNTYGVGPFKGIAGISNLHIATGMSFSETVANIGGIYNATGYGPSSAEIGAFAGSRFVDLLKFQTFFLGTGRAMKMLAGDSSVDPTSIIPAALRPLLFGTKSGAMSRAYGTLAGFASGGTLGGLAGGTYGADLLKKGGLFGFFGKSEEDINGYLKEKLEFTSYKKNVKMSTGGTLDLDYLKKMGTSTDELKNIYKTELLTQRELYSNQSKITSDLTSATSKLFKSKFGAIGDYIGFMGVPLNTMADSIRFLMNKDKYINNPLEVTKEKLYTIKEKVKKFDERVGANVLEETGNNITINSTHTMGSKTGTIGRFIGLNAARIMRYNYISDTFLKPAYFGTINATLDSAKEAITAVRQLGRMEFGTGKTLDTRMASTERGRAISAMQNVGISARSYLGQEALLMSQV